ncbi:MAG: NADH-quinone oxidoreductase subunit NuoH [Phycisphaerales bacterium]|nr:NADH-quinone oxidoreductase subunit NuoH [Phycisphaerales bacterium]
MMDLTVNRVERTLRSPLLLLFLVVVAGPAATVVGIWTLVQWSVVQQVLADPFWFPLVVMGTMLFIILNGCAVCILAERKIASFTQDRHGPNRVGYWGWLQPIADGLKFFLKEDITPHHVDKPIFTLAPIVAMITALLGFAIIPWAGYVVWPWMPASATPLSTQAAALNIGVLWIVAVGSLGVYGIVLAGYASNNKYSFYGGMRATAQMISYELPIGLALLCMLLATGTLRLDEMVNQQAASGIWYIFLYPVPFLLLLIGAFAEGNRAPFDLAEAEQELVGGFHTEYSSMRFALFFLGEYAHMITASAFIAAIFLGGWAPLPFVSFYSTLPDGTIEPTAWNVSWWAMLIKFGAFLAKITVLIAFFMFIRWTIPRFRFDQLMRITWQGLVPIGILLVALIAVLVAFNLQRVWWAALGVNLLTIVITLLVVARAGSPVTGRQTDLPTPEVRPAAAR